MFNHAGVGPFHVIDPDFETSGRDWLIIERHGKALIISDGNIPSEPGDIETGVAAPSGLSENFSVYGRHIQTSQNGQTSTFMLASFAPSGASSEGRFLPACGLVTVSSRSDMLTLSAHGQEALDYTYDIEYGACGETVSRSHHTAHVSPNRWAFSATYRPWAAEQWPRPATMRLVGS